MADKKFLTFFIIPIQQGVADRRWQLPGKRYDSTMVRPAGQEVVAAVSTCGYPSSFCLIPLVF